MIVCDDILYEIAQFAIKEMDYYFCCRAVCRRWQKMFDFAFRKLVKSDPFRYGGSKLSLFFSSKLSILLSSIEQIMMKVLEDQCDGYALDTVLATKKFAFNFLNKFCSSRLGVQSSD